VAVPFLLALGVLWSTPADAQSAGIKFIEAQPGQPNGPTDPIHIVIPPEISTERQQNFAVALDNLDVTLFVEWHGSFAILTPPVPLSPGTHSVLAGAPIAEVDWEGEIISCPDEVATALGIAGRTLVLANAGGAPVEAGIISYRIDRCKFRFHEIFQHKKP
jgi:hypothetical protein